MNLAHLKKLKLPDTPGVYFFRKGGPSGTVLYIGKATSLRDRVKSYFADDLIKTRGRLLVDMVTRATTVTFEQTDSVLEAFLLESELIKKYMPRHNTDGKDNKSFNYVVLTKEDFPRVLVVRGRELEMEHSSRLTTAKPSQNFEYIDTFGPYPYGNELHEALRLIRKIFPFRDKCVPYDEVIAAGKTPRPCFNRSIGLCPGVCSGDISKKEYARQIQNIRLFFKGKKTKLVAGLKRQMKVHSKKLEFEQAHEIKKTLQALSHIQDISMLKRNTERNIESRGGEFSGEVDGTNEAIGRDQNGQGITRIEAYDIAHLSGKDMVGVMVVMEDGEFAKNQYKKFNIKTVHSSNDTAALREVLNRRLAHSEWAYPSVFVIDGGQAQLNAAEEVLKGKLNEELNCGQNVDMGSIGLVSVVKDDKHKAREVLRSKVFPVTFSGIDDNICMQINAESHRFAVAVHAKRRSISRGL